MRSLKSGGLVLACAALAPLFAAVDTTPPVISGLPATGCSLWPPNQKLVHVGTVTATDVLSGLAAGSFRVNGTSNEPSNPNDPDIVITPNGSGGFDIQLRAERLGDGAGRIYTLTATASDLAGNSAKATATCIVPHDREDTPAAPPTAPGNLTAKAAGKSQINLSWRESKSSVEVAKYSIERCQGNGCSNFAQIATTEDTTYNDTKLASNTSYSYRVRAADTAGNFSGYSNVASAAAEPTAIFTENQKPGTSLWRIPFGASGSDAVGQIKGYTSAVSVNKGENITFHVSVNPPQTYTIDVYRLGWYQGLGGRLMQHIGPLNGVQQATCPTDATTGMIECHWTPGYTLATQDSWTSGIYVGVLTNPQGYQNYTMFCVRDDRRDAALLYQQPVTTYQAYNDYPYDTTTGKSLYAFNSYGATTVSGGKNAVKVSFDRPYLGDGAGNVWSQDFFTWEFAFVRWMEMSGYDVTYATDIDTHINGRMLLNYRGILSVAHNEYFSKPMYDAWVAAVGEGVNLGFFGADAIDWQVRFEPSSTGVRNRVVVCYRDATLDPTTDPSLKTVEWTSPPLNRPQQTLLGGQYKSQTQWNPQTNGYFPYVVTNSGNWVYAGTGFKDGDSVPGMVGYETDRFFSQYPPPNAVSGTYLLLSNSPYTNNSGAADSSNSSVYQAPSGAWVFTSGTMGWSYGLDNINGNNFVDLRIQRTTANILNRFVARPGHDEDNPPER